MRIQNPLATCLLLAVAVCDLFTVKSQEFRYKNKNGIRTNQEIAQWIDNVKLSSKTRNIPQLFSRIPDGGDRVFQNKPWKALKESILQGPHPLPKVQFVKMSRSDLVESERSLAVLQPNQSGSHVHTGILSLAAAVMFVVVLVICIHAPCTCLWRRRHRNDLEVDLISCPNPTAHDGKCGKCLYDRVTRKRASKFGFSKRPFSSPASIATIQNEELYMPYENQPWVTDSNKGQSSTLPNPKKSRSIVQAILKRSRDRDKFRYEFLASRYGYNYKQFRDSYKRSSIYDEQDPNWYSAGEFLNTQSNRGKKNYGSTEAGKSVGATTCCKWSRGQQQSTNQSVEDIVKLQPRRRQVVELQEFPVGYSGTYAGFEGNFKENELFDPLYDTQSCCHADSLRAGSESNIDMYFSRLDNNNLMPYTEKTYKKTQSTSPTSSTNIVQNFPTEFDYDPKFVQKEGEKKKGKEIKKEWEDDDSDLCETSSDDLLSFDEWDAALERRERKSQEFLYSPHMQASRQHCHHLHHSYPAVLRYPNIPRDTRALPREYKTRMRRHAARSEIELRRSSGCFGQTPACNGQSAAYHSSSDSSLHRMQIEKELEAAGLNKQRKKQKDPPVRIRDNRLDPLAGLMTPKRPLKETDKPNTAERKLPSYLSKTNKHSSDIADSRDKWETDLKVCLTDDSYVVKLPSLGCKESVIHEHEEEGKGETQDSCKDKLELNNDKHEPNYSRVHLELDPHYIKNSYLREEPVRDTDSDDGDRNRSTELTTGNTNQTSNNTDDTFSSNRSTRL